jgi:hypothetical protein
MDTASSVTFDHSGEYHCHGLLVCPPHLTQRPSETTYVRRRLVIPIIVAVVLIVARAIGSGDDTHATVIVLICRIIIVIRRWWRPAIHWLRFDLIIHIQQQQTVNK